MSGAHHTAPGGPENGLPPISREQKVRLIRQVLGDQQLNTTQIIQGCEDLGFPYGRIIRNWLAKLSKDGVFIRKVRRGLYEAGGAPPPPPTRSPILTVAERRAPAFLPRAPAEHEQTAVPLHTPAPPQAAPDVETVSLIGEDGNVDMEKVYTVGMRRTHQALTKQECPTCGGVKSSGPVNVQMNQYISFAKELSVIQSSRGQSGMAETIHNQTREIEHLTRDLREAKARVTELERAAL